MLNFVHNVHQAFVKEASDWFVIMQAFPHILKIRIHMLFAIALVL